MGIGGGRACPAGRHVQLCQRGRAGARARRRVVGIGRYAVSGSRCGAPARPDAAAHHPGCMRLRVWGRRESR